ncbi:MAG TPA: hypothetical protein VF546_09730 [Pyrinomonadaceae bacterium]
MGHALVVAVDADRVGIEGGGLKLQDVRTSLLKPDARPATVFIDVADVTPADFAAEAANLK